MSTPWFERHVYQVVVDKKFCDKKTLAVLKQKAVAVKMWDPFGNLLFK